MKFHELAKRISTQEGKKKASNIAQINEILSLVLINLRELPLGERNRLLKVRTFLTPEMVGVFGIGVLTALILLS